MIHFATLTTEDYVPGVLALGQSLYENSGFNKDIKLHILIPNGLSEQSRNKINKLPIDIDYYNRDWLIEYNCSNEYIPDHKKLNQYKFNVFRLPCKKVTFLDSDMLCLANIKELENMSGMTVGINIGKDRFRNINARPVFNAGMFVCEPSKTLFDELQCFGESWDRKINRGDQPILNEFYLTKYPDNVHYLGLNWNVAQSCKRWRPKIWADAQSEGIKFLHYTQIKPWTNVWPTSLDELWKIRDKLPKRYWYFREPLSWWYPFYKRALSNTN